MYLIILVALLTIERAAAERVGCVRIDMPIDMDMSMNMPMLTEYPQWVDHVCGYYSSGCLCNEHHAFAASICQKCRLPRVAELILVALSLVMSTIAMWFAFNCI